MASAAGYATQNWTLRKPAARGRRGVVVAQARDAAQAGLDVLDAGGNAADAAVATALALAVVEPWNSGLGGIGYALVQAPGSAAQVVDFGPVAPRGIDPARFPLTGAMKYDLFPWPQVAGDVNVHGPLSFAIPSAPAGYGLIHARWGRLPWREVAAPAVALARRGLALDWYTALKIASAAAELRLYAGSAATYLPDGLPPAPGYGGGAAFRPLGRLPETMERLQSHGIADFYRGEVAAAMAADLREMEAALTAEDLAATEAVLRPPHTIPYAGGTLQVPGTGTAGPTLGEVLARIPAAAGGRPDAAWFVAAAGALRDRYAARLAGESSSPGATSSASCTTHLTVMDADGMAASVTTTLLSTMGSRCVLPRSGVLLNNGIMWFDPRPDSANALRPGRRPLTNMLPFILATDGHATLAGGSSGGRRIMASVLQMLAFIAGFGIDPEAAAHLPRIDVSGPDMVTADRALPADVLAALGAAGPIEVVENTVIPVQFASPNVIARGADGSRIGISDAGSPWSAALAQA